MICSIMSCVTLSYLDFVGSCVLNVDNIAVSVSWNQGLWNWWFQPFKISAFSIPTKNCHILHMYMSIYIYIHTYIHRTFIHDIWLSFCHDITFKKVQRFFNGCWNQDGNLLQKSIRKKVPAVSFPGCKPNKTNMNMENSNHLKMYPLLSNADFPACHVRMPEPSNRGTSPHYLRWMSCVSSDARVGRLGKNGVGLENECWKIRDNDKNPMTDGPFFLGCYFENEQWHPNPGHLLWGIKLLN